MTVVIPPDPTVGSCEVRGGAPATRETALLDPVRHVERVDAVVFSGGSAFGLDAATGVMHALAEAGRGHPTSGGVVPIVPAACIFDLAASGGVKPTSVEGRLAYDAASVDPVPTGRVGAGTGATVGKWRGIEYAAPGGVGSASARCETATVGALAVVNAVGDVLDGHGAILSGSSAPPHADAFPEPPLAAGEHTTLVVVATNARLSKLDCLVLAQAAEVGLVRALNPAVTRFDGDIAFVLGRPPEDPDGVDVHFDRLRIVVADVVTHAVRASVAAPDTDAAPMPA